MAESNRTKGNTETVTAGKTYDFVYGRLKSMMGPAKARAYALFCQAIFDEIQGNHDLSEGLKQVAAANKLQPMARQLQLTKSVQTLRDLRLSGIAGVTNVFVDRFKALADYYGIEVNQCSLAVTKVCLDIGSAGLGAVSSVTGVGIVWLGLSVIATFQDSYALGNVCMPSR